MRRAHLRYLCCPDCRRGLNFFEVEQERNGIVEEGALGCVDCEARYPILRSVPRFVSTKDFDNFAFEWNKHARTQLDSYSGASVSEDRFFASSAWPRHLDGEVILEVGSGAGRFTEQAANTGAVVVSFDYSQAVDANYQSNGHRPNVLIIQADLNRPPVPPEMFDRVFCFGVLQHTPDPAKSFRSLLPPLKPGGQIAVDIYAKRWWTPLRTKYWIRPITKRLPFHALYRGIEGYIDFMWPIVKKIGALPFGRKVNSALLVADYRGKFPLDDDQLKEWAVLDTFDRLSPLHDHPRSLSEVKSWFRESGLEDVHVEYGWNGIVARGVKPARMPGRTREIR